MKKLLLSISLILFVISLPASAQEDWLDVEKLNEYLEKVVKTGKLSGLAVSIVTADEVLFSKGFGYADVENERAVTPETLFFLGSVSKAFTAATVASIVEDGILAWDEPVIGYYPSLRLQDSYVERNATLLDLMSHKTGLPRHEYVWYDNDRSRESILATLPLLEPSATFREQYQYNNLMFVLAGHIAGRITDSTYEDQLRTRILQPTGMTGTFVEFESFLNAEDRALGYTPGDEGPELTDYQNIDAMAPAGGIYSNLTDMNKYMQMLLNQGSAGETEVLKAQSVKRLMTPITYTAGYPASEDNFDLGYGLGWVMGYYNGAIVANHGGGINGFSTLVYILPHRGLGITVLANHEGAAPLNQIVSAHILDQYLDVEPQGRLAQYLFNVAAGESIQSDPVLTVANDVPATLPLESYAGIYKNAAYGEAVVSVVDDGLEVKLGNTIHQLKHHNGDFFRTDSLATATYVEFQINREGEVIYMSSALEPSVEAIVFRRDRGAELTSGDYLEQFTGDYFIGPQKSTFSINKQGDLKLQITGQQPLILEPVTKNKFKLKDMPVDIEILFRKSEGSEVYDQAVFNQPNGTFIATRAAQKDGSEK